MRVNGMGKIRKRFFFSPSRKNAYSCFTGLEWEKKVQVAPANRSSINRQEWKESLFNNEVGRRGIVMSQAMVHDYESGDRILTSWGMKRRHERPAVVCVLVTHSPSFFYLHSVMYSHWNFLREKRDDLRYGNRVQWLDKKKSQMDCEKWKEMKREHDCHLTSCCSTPDCVLLLWILPLVLSCLVLSCLTVIPRKLGERKGNLWVKHGVLCLHGTRREDGEKMGKGMEGKTKVSEMEWSVKLPSHTHLLLSLFLRPVNRWHTRIQMHLEDFRIRLRCGYVCQVNARHTT